MTNEPNEGEKAVHCIGEGQPDSECSNDWFLTRDEFAHSVAHTMRNARKSGQAQSPPGRDQPDTSVRRESQWAPDYTKILAGKAYFLMDSCNLREGAWMCGRTILSGHDVRKFFTGMCRVAGMSISVRSPYFMEGACTRTSGRGSACASRDIF